MNELETARKRMQVAKAEAAKIEYEYKKLKIMEEVKRIDEQIALQDETIIKLKGELDG